MHLNILSQNDLWKTKKRKLEILGRRRRAGKMKAIEKSGSSNISEKD